MSHKFVDSVCLKLENSVYGKYNLVNVKELEKNKEKLLSDVQYLPYFIRFHLRDEYYNSIVQNIEVYRKIKEDNETSIKYKTRDFIKWINQHKEYHKLLDSEKLKQLNKELEETEKEINYFKKMMK